MTSQLVFVIFSQNELVLGAQAEFVKTPPQDHERKKQSCEHWGRCAHHSRIGKRAPVWPYPNFRKTPIGREWKRSAEAKTLVKVEGEPSMKNPGACPRVSKGLRKEFQLTEGIARLTLLLHISLHCVLVGTLSQGGKVVSVLPKLAPPKAPSSPMAYAEIFPWP